MHNGCYISSILKTLSEALPSSWNVLGSTVTEQGVCIFESGHLFHLK